MPSGAWCEQPRVRRVADDRADRDEVDPREDRRRSTASAEPTLTSPNGSIISPPASISYVVAVNGSLRHRHACGRERADRPHHRREQAQSRRRSRSRRPTGCSSTATPTKPTPTPASVAPRIFSPATRRSTHDPERHRRDDQRREPDRRRRARRRRAPRSRPAAARRSRCTTPSCAPADRAATRRARRTIAAMIEPAAMKRVETASIGGIVSTAIAITRYVEPQMM